MMTRRSTLRLLVAGLLAASLQCQSALAVPNDQAGFEFAVLGHSFKAGPDDAPLKKAIADLDPDALTPRDALEQLYQLKRLAAA